MSITKLPVVPIFSLNTKNKLSLIATATLVNIDNQRYFLTAGHAADALKSEQTSMLINDRVYHLNKLAWNRMPPTSLYPVNKSDDYDFALMRVPDCLNEILDLENFFFEASTFEEEDLTEKELIHVYGFPGAKCNRAITQKYANVHCYKLVTTNETNKLSKDRFHPEVHLAVEFDKNSAVSEEWIEIHPPDFHGVSGGPAISSINNKLLGILIEADFPNKILIFTRIRVIAKWVNNCSSKFQ